MTSTSDAETATGQAPAAATGVVLATRAIAVAALLAMKAFGMGLASAMLCQETPLRWLQSKIAIHVISVPLSVTTTEVPLDL